MAEITYEPTGCNCAGTDYTKADINAAATEALKLASEKKTLGNDKYPHVYNDYEKFTFAHAKKPYLEFPVLQNGKVYSGGSPGADRIVIGSISTDYSSAVYCATITHDGSSNNGFTECQDDTMNVNGKGDYKHHTSHHKQKELLDRIDM